MKSAHKLIIALMAFGFLSTAAQSQTIEILNEPLAACDVATIAYRDFPVVAGPKGNWIAIAEQSMVPSMSTYRFVYLPAQANGRIQLSTRGLVPFMPYEIRGFINWDATRSYDIVARQEFSVFPRSACRSPMITRVDGFVESGAMLNFSFMDLRPGNSNWVSISRPGQNAPVVLKSKFLPPASTGDASIDTSGLVPGTYELRLFEDWARTKEYFVYSRVLFEIR